MKEETFLGKKVDYKSTYDPSLIVPVPRQENRTSISIINDNLPFVGYDVWNAYEIGCLNKNGVPFSGIAKIVYPCNSEFIVESKSLKLYLNSFNMTKIDAESFSVVKDILEETIKTDLSHALKTDVKAHIHDISSGELNLESTAGSLPVSLENVVLEQLTPNQHIVCTEYNENPQLLNVNLQEFETLQTHSYISKCLRSNCKVTHQPDWGDVYITYTSYKHIDETQLYKYLISFRNESHFHEEICETIYKRLYDILNPVDLVVACFYTRRGGIDINPIRSWLDTGLRCFKDYINVENISEKTIRQ